MALEFDVSADSLKGPQCEDAKKDYVCKGLKNMARPGRLELPTLCLEVA